MRQLSEALALFHTFSTWSRASVRQVECWLVRHRKWYGLLEGNTWVCRVLLVLALEVVRTTGRLKIVGQLHFPTTLKVVLQHRKWYEQLDGVACLEQQLGCGMMLVHGVLCSWSSPCVCHCCQVVFFTHFLREGGVCAGSLLDFCFFFCGPLVSGSHFAGVLLRTRQSVLTISFSTKLLHAFVVGFGTEKWS